MSIDVDSKYSVYLREVPHYKMNEEVKKGLEKFFGPYKRLEKPVDIETIMMGIADIYIGLTRAAVNSLVKASSEGTNNYAVAAMLPKVNEEFIEYIVGDSDRAILVHRDLVSLTRLALDSTSFYARNPQYCEDQADYDARGKAEFLIAVFYECLTKRNVQDQNNGGDES